MTINHLTTESGSGDDLTRIMGNIHRKSAKAIRQHTLLRAVKKVWHNYWDRCVRDEREYYNCLNYMFWNPVKHGYVKEALQ